MRDRIHSHGRGCSPIVMLHEPCPMTHSGELCQLTHYSNSKVSGSRSKQMETCVFSNRSESKTSLIEQHEWYSHMSSLDCRQISQTLQ